MTDRHASSTGPSRGTHPAERPVRLVALDIDGTLLDSHGRLPAANVAVIERAVAAGVEVVLATGRRFEFARSIFEALPSSVTLILGNGTIVKTTDGETLARSLMPRDAAREILARTRAHRPETALVFDRPLDGQVVFEAIDWDHPRHRAFFRANRRFLAEHAPLEGALTEDPLQVMITGPCREMRDLFGRLRSAGAWAVALTEYARHDFSLVDVCRAGCSKGTALAAWARARGCAPEEVMAVGDNLNDLDMLEFAGRPVVMANAVDDLKQHGWAETGSNDDAGVAQAFETFVFGRAS